MDEGDEFLPLVYLDHSSTTPVRIEVLELVNKYMLENFGNPSNTHKLGREAKAAMERARKQMADAVGACEDEVYFTSGGTESDNIAIIGAAYQNCSKGRHIITSAIEHNAVLDAFEFLKRQGFSITLLPVDNYGMVDLADVERYIKKDTILISVMHANNEVGTIEPVEQIGQLAKERGIVFHVDAVGSFGKIPIDVQKIGADLLSGSGHKIHGPKGTGFLYVRKGVELRPLVYGGQQEKGLRPGTENISGIIGMGLAAELAVNDMDVEMRRLSRLRDKLIKGLTERIPDVKLNGHREKRVPINVNLSFDFVNGKELLELLDSQGIAASSGSACSASSAKPSHVLTAMGLSNELAQGTVRMTLGRDNSIEDIEYVLGKLPLIVESLRQNPYKSEQRTEAEKCPCLH